MHLTIPVLIEEIRPVDQPGPAEHRLQPLFIGEPRGSSTSLSRGLAGLRRSLTSQLMLLSREGKHAAVSAYGFFPDVRIESFAVRLDLRGGPMRAVVPVATFPQWSRLLGFLPDARDVWFQLEPKGDHEARVTDVLTRVFREFERRLDPGDFDTLLGRFREPRRRLSIVPVSVWFDPDQRLERPRDDSRAALGSEQVFDGQSELAKVGRCLDDLHPDRLDRCFGRDDTVAEMERLLAAADHRPVAIIGPRLVGKTAVLHEVIHRRAEAEAGGTRASRHGTAEFWTISPQRLIAGMSYLGQWEQRLLAILDFVAKRQHVLVLDDVLGLYGAGQSSQSDLCVADVLRPRILARRVRVIAEMTPEQHRLLAERDRGLADAFHVVRLDEPSADETLGILLEVVALLEARHGARFAPDAVAAAVRLTRRHQRGAAFPGKAIRALAGLAVRSPASHRGLAIDPLLAATGQGRAAWGRDPAAEGAAEHIDRRSVLLDFQERSGMVPAFIDDEARLPRGDVVAGLRRLLVGQDAAVDALADVVSLAKAGLNDPERPLGSLLLVGPTGVGKTQAAKALATVLFGDPGRLLRFDMNEFASADAAARLAGSFANPEGLLTAAVRRQPFCVLLFDEIEKAHSDVFDLLLQVLGEARLTDAAGLTTDFSSAVILMTSNLGSREAARGLGFGGADAATASVYRRAVEGFFRPEFVNRLDHVVMFDDLSRRQMTDIAERVLAEVPAREGLARRRCVLDVSPAVLEWVVDRGYDRALGARAMKRAVERDLVQPVARQLAATAPELPTVIAIRPHPATGISVQVAAIEQAVPPSRQLDIAALSPEDYASRVAAVLDRLTEQCRQHRPETPASFRNVPAEYAWHLGFMAQITDLRRERGEASDRRMRQVNRQPLSAGLGWDLPAHEQSRTWRGVSLFRNYVREMAAAIDIRDYLREIASAAPPQAARDRETFVSDTLARLDLMGPGVSGWHFEQALVVVRSVAAAGPERAAMLGRISAALALPQVGFDAEWHRGEPVGEPTAGTDDGSSRHWWDMIADEAVRRRQRQAFRLDVAVISGQRALAFAGGFEGTYLMCTADGRLLPFLAVALPLPADRQPGEVLAECLAAHEAAIAAGGDADADPLRWRPVIEIVAADGFRPLSREDFLPLPPEFTE